MKRLSTPLVQVILALAGIYGGAALVDFAHAPVLGGTVLATWFVLLVDGLFRNPGRPQSDPRELTVNDVLERYERAR